MAEVLSYKTLLQATNEVEGHAKELMMDYPELGLIMLESVELGNAETAARALMTDSSEKLSSVMQIALRDLYVLQLGKGARIDAKIFDAHLQNHFGQSMPLNLRSNLYLAKHHLDVGKFGKRRRATDRCS